MEGRTIARPNHPDRARRNTGDTASMEGRTIARPNPLEERAAGPPGVLLQWRAGQLPGQTWLTHPKIRGVLRLQWRAGQLPGQTAAPEVERGRVRGASMEGRTIARPNDGLPPPRPRPRGASMEGRTIARPNAPAAVITAGRGLSLQWRAGQLPGQTCSRRSRRRCSSTRLQWRAGQLPGQTPPLLCHRHDRRRASMEGRTIARPNQGRGRRLPGGHHASMEGRTIARPNEMPPTPTPAWRR